jgi:peptide/nickel transport system permease protein
MTAILLRRLVRLIVISFGISLITFLLMHLSGDPVTAILPEATEADRAILREAMGFNRPLLMQYGSFMVRAVQGDFGQSLYHRAPALPLVFERMPTTLLLTLFALLLAVIIAIPAGIFHRRQALLCVRSLGHRRRATWPVDAGLLDWHHADFAVCRRS